MKSRRLFPVLAVVSVMLASCTTPQDPGVAARVKAAQDAAVKLCGFLPIAETIIDIIGISGAGSAAK